MKRKKVVNRATFLFRFMVILENLQKTRNIYLVDFLIQHNSIVPDDDLLYGSRPIHQIKSFREV
jgi:hypothetical protein